MQFIVEQQADLAARLQSLEVIVRLQSAQIAEHSVQIAEHSTQIALHSTQIGEITSQIGQIQDLLLRTVRIVDEQGRQTDDRINALIAVVEKYRSNGRN
jgi:uncharacterized coiled-coil protein SlyX